MHNLVSCLVRLLASGHLLVRSGSEEAMEWYGSGVGSLNVLSPAAIAGMRDCVLQGVQASHCVPVCLVDSAHATCVLRAGLCGQCVAGAGAARGQRLRGRRLLDP
jgi:hypothetical protein